MVKEKIKNLTIGVLCIALLALMIKLFSFSTPVEENKKKNNKSKAVGEQPVNDYLQKIDADYNVYAVPVPDKMDFSGENVPLQDVDIHDRLDRELTVNTFWHSSTFFYLKKANRWFPIIEPILKEQGIPDDFKYLALVESGLSDVKSPAGAAGFWQFMPSTAKGYGLEVNKYVDERYNLEKATYAACKYLKEAHRKFGSWTVVAASYNMGMGGVQSRMNEQLTQNYYDLYLNAETARYVFRILAAKQILTHPTQYGFNIRESEKYAPYQTKQVEVDTTVNSLVQFGKTMDVNYKIIKKLNPWLISDKLPNTSAKKYTILLPAEGFNLKPAASYP